MSSSIRESESRGFTLIELLVVIAIVGLLSAIVLTSLKSARDKSTVAASYAFDQNIFHAMGDQLVVQYDFNTNTGTTLSDSSISKNDGTLNGGSLPIWSQGISPLGTGYSLLFSGSNSVTSANPININGSPFTMSAWFMDTNGTKSGASQARVVTSARAACGGNFIQLYDTDGWSCGGNASASFTDSNNVGQNICATSYPTPFVWHNIVSTFDGTNKLKLYLDGKLNNTFTTSGLPFSLGSGGQTLRIADDSCAGNNFVGYIDNVRLYKQAITAADIQSEYYKGFVEHLAKK